MCLFMSGNGLPLSAFIAHARNQTDEDMLKYIATISYIFFIRNQIFMYVDILTSEICALSYLENIQLTKERHSIVL